MDSFEKLGVASRLVVNEEELDRNLRELSRKAHPDSGGDQHDFELVRQAGRELKEPLLRLKLAIGLSGGDPKSRGAVDNEIMDFFSPVAGLMERVELFLGERGRAKSNLARALLDAQVPPLKKEIEAMIERLGELEQRLLSRFQQFDDVGWAESISAMEETSRALAFVLKWKGQLQGATGKLFEALLGG